MDRSYPFFFAASLSVRFRLEVAPPCTARRGWWVVGGMRWLARVAAGHLLHHKRDPFESQCTRARPVVGGPQHERRMTNCHVRFGRFFLLFRSVGGSGGWFCGGCTTVLCQLARGRPVGYAKRSRVIHRPASRRRRDTNTDSPRPSVRSAVGCIEWCNRRERHPQ